MSSSHNFRFSKVIRMALIPSAAVIANEEKINDQKEKLICRPSDLPIYSHDIPTPRCIEEKPTWLGHYLQEKIAGLRLVAEKIVKEVNAYEQVAEEYVRQGVDKADGALTYLRQENNTAPKIGAIAIGGISGLILSLRKGYFKKTLYVTTGALAMTAVCYPKQTTEYADFGIQEGKKYATIAYNFAYGDQADSDDSCIYRPDYGNEEEVSDEEVVCHCFDESDSMEVEDTCPYL